MSQSEAVSKPGPTGSPALQSFFATLGKVPRVALLSVVGPFLLLVIGYVLWITYGAKHLDRSQYGLREENLHITPQPAWIRSDVRKEVFVGSSLDRLNTLDKQMGPVVYNAFRVHPWIRKVFRVGKISERDVKVLVEYREPIAMIYEESVNVESLRSRSTAAGKTASGGFISNVDAESNPRQTFHFFPVDIDGVLLPTKDFLPEQIPNYFLVYAQGSVPRGKKFGGDYGDTRIKEALLLCRALRDDREPLGLEKIYVYPDGGDGLAAHFHLEITTKSGKRIQWGHAPGLETSGEPGAPAKQRKLREILLNPNSPDAAAMEIDLVDKAKARLSESFRALMSR